MSHPKDTGKEGYTELPKFRSEKFFFTEVGFEPGQECQVAIPRQRSKSNPLGHRAQPFLLNARVVLLMNLSALLARERVCAMFFVLHILTDGDSQVFCGVCRFRSVLWSE